MPSYKRKERPPTPEQLRNSGVDIGSTIGGTTKDEKPLTPEQERIRRQDADSSGEGLPLIRFITRRNRTGSKKKRKNQ